MSLATLRLSFLLLTIALLQFFETTIALEVLYPSAAKGSYWVTNATNSLFWSHAVGDPDYFSVELINSNSSNLAGNFRKCYAVCCGGRVAELLKHLPLPIEVGNALMTENGTAQIPLDLIPFGTYTILFVNSSNYALDNPQVYYTSPSFEIKPNGTTSASYTPATGVTQTANTGTTVSQNSTSSLALVSPTNKVQASSNGGFTTGPAIHSILFVAVFVLLSISSPL